MSVLKTKTVWLVIDLEHNAFACRVTNLHYTAPYVYLGKSLFEATPCPTRKSASRLYKQANKELNRMRRNAKRQANQYKDRRDGTTYAARWRRQGREQLEKLRHVKLAIIPFTATG